jgi:hypothetical protein
MFPEHFKKWIMMSLYVKAGAFQGANPQKLDFFYFNCSKLYQYKAGTPHREGSEISLKRAKREQTEEEAGSHRGSCATEPPNLILMRRFALILWKKSFSGAGLL